MSSRRKTSTICILASVVVLLAQAPPSRADAPDSRLAAVLETLLATPNADSTAADDESDYESEQRALRTKALEKFAVDDVDAAVEALEKLIELNPCEPEHYLALGVCLRRAGRFEDALRRFQHGLDAGGDEALVASLRRETEAEQRTAKEMVPQVSVLRESTD
jgi:Flp pilus assembly protein TadD